MEGSSVLRTEIQATIPSGMRIPTLEELLRQDLDYICANLQYEFGRMAGDRLLITGGAGFLGYYLVQAALHYNKTAGKAPIDVTAATKAMRS